MSDFAKVLVYRILQKTFKRFRRCFSSMVTMGAGEFNFKEALKYSEGTEMEGKKELK